MSQERPGRKERCAEMKALRLASGRTQVDFAEHLGLSGNHLSRVERGISDVSESALRLARRIPPKDQEEFEQSWTGASKT